MVLISLNTIRPSGVRTRSTKGKNLLFQCMIVLAYFFGVVHKLFFSRDIALYFYLLNSAMVIADLILYFINRNGEIRKGLIGNYHSVLV